MEVSQLTVLLARSTSPESRKRTPMRSPRTAAKSLQAWALCCSHGSGKAWEVIESAEGERKSGFQFWCLTNRRLGDGFSLVDESEKIFRCLVKAVNGSA